jgi:hypothetical protein
MISNNVARGASIDLRLCPLREEGGVKIVKYEPCCHVVMQDGTYGTRMHECHGSLEDAQDAVRMWLLGWDEEGGA